MIPRPKLLAIPIVLSVLVACAVLLLMAPRAKADGAYFYPRALLQQDECGTWAEDGQGGVLWDSTGACWEGGGPVEFGWRGGGDVAWSAREINGAMTGKDFGALAVFEYLYVEDGLWLIVVDVAIPSTDPPIGPPEDGTGDPVGGGGGGGGGCVAC